MGMLIYTFGVSICHETPFSHDLSQFIYFLCKNYVLVLCQNIKRYKGKTTLLFFSPFDLLVESDFDQ